MLFSLGVYGRRYAFAVAFVLGFVTVSGFSFLFPSSSLSSSVLFLVPNVWPALTRSAAEEIDQLEAEIAALSEAEDPLWRLYAEDEEGWLQEAVAEFEAGQSSRQDGAMEDIDGG